jgi:putative ABC transport system permease protein
MRSLFSLFRTLSTRYLSKRWDRTGLVVISIGLGVSMLVSTQLLNHCLDNVVRESTAPGIESADLCVTANRKVRIELAAKLQTITGVQSAQSLAIERVILPEFDNRTAVLLGLRAAGNQIEQKNPFGARVTFTNPAGFLTGRGCVVGRDLARVLDPERGQPSRPFQIRAGGKVQSITPVGVVELDGPASKLGGFLLAMDVTQASEVFGTPGVCERIDLYLAPGANHERVQELAQAMIGDAAQVRSPQNNTSATNEIVSGVRIFFTLGGVGAMVVGLFLVYNSLSVSVAERRHDIGVLRSVGATRPQIAGLFTAEALILGAVGALLGIPLGWLLAKLTFQLMRREMEQMFLTASQPMPVTMSLFLLAVTAGMATAVLAALVPALQAASDEPADAVRRAPTGAAKFFRYLQAVAAAAFACAGFSMAILRHYLPQRVGGIGGMVLLLLALLLAVPILVTAISRLVRPMVRRFFGIETRLASDNLLRSPGRTGVVVGALAAGVALIFQTAGIGQSNEEPILEWLDRIVNADVFVVCGNPSTSSSAALPMDPAMFGTLRNLPGIRDVLSVRYNLVEFRGRIIWITALDSEKFYESHQQRSRFPKFHLFKDLKRPNTVLVSENFAALYGVNEGETIALQGPNGPVNMQVIGIIQDYSWSRGSIMLDRQFYAEAFQDPLVDSFSLFFQQDADRVETNRRVKETCDAHALAVVQRGEFDQWVTNMIRRAYLLSYLQQVAVAVVAALGVVMALLISVLQRRRELGLLRAVGATQGQVLHTVIAEATLMGIFGTILGLIAGVPLEWFILRVIVFEDTGFIFPVTIPWQQTSVLCILAVFVATVAGLVPALHAARLRIAEAIQYE